MHQTKGTEYRSQVIASIAHAPALESHLSKGTEDLAADFRAAGERGSANPLRAVATGPLDDRSRED